MKHTHNILVVLPSPMGDAILCGPALRRLRQCLPGARITLLANHTAREILTGAPWVDDWLTLDKTRVGPNGADLSSRHTSPPPPIRRLRSRNFDAALLMTNSFRSALLVYRAGIKKRIGYNRDGRRILLTCPVPVPCLIRRPAPISMGDYYGFLVDNALQYLGGYTTAAPPVSCRYPSGPENHLSLFTTESDRREIDKLLKRWRLTDDKRLVIMVPGAAFGPSKCWPGERFAQLAVKLTDDRYRVIVSCAPNRAERDIARQIIAAAGCGIYNLTDEGISLAGLKELIRRCCLMVGNDTGPCHIAAAFNVPLVTIFGPTDPRWTATGYPGEIRLRTDVDCGPCRKQICPRDHRCMTEITVAEVYAAAKQLLSSPTPGVPNSNSIYRLGSYYSPFAESFAPLSDGTGLVHKDYRMLLDRQGLGNLADVFAYRQGQLLHKPGLGTRQRLRLDLTSESGQKVILYLKRYYYPGLFQLLQRRLSRRRPAAAAVYDFAAAITLAESALPVARPIAFGQESNWLGEKRSFVILEELPHADALERLLPRRPEMKTKYALLREKNTLIMRLAQLVRRLHERGFFHRDLYLAHIFLSRDSAGCERLNLIDLQRIFQPRVRPRRWRVKDLAQLYYSARNYCSRTDCVRFLREYFQSCRLTAAQQRLARSVYRKARRIARHDHNRMRNQ